jgi:hypothetical protein
LIPPANWKSLYVRSALDPSIRSDAATVQWNNWWEELKPRLMARRVVIASYAINAGELSWGYRYALGLSEEIDWVQDKLDDWNKALERIATKMR